jgi:hypothetical protein
MSIEAIRVGDPSQAAGCDSGDAKGDSVAGAEFGCAVAQEFDEGAVNVAEAEEAEIVGMDARPSGAKARSLLVLYAALKRRFHGGSKHAERRKTLDSNDKCR